MSFHALVNTQYFSEAAIGWKKNGGMYTTAPRGSRDYLQYWEEQERRCKYGYKVGDLWIPGRYYDHLNFFPISRVPESVMLKAIEEQRGKRGKLSVRTAEKIISFPSFWEIQYEWNMFKHVAWYGGEFMGIQSPGGKHMVCVKTRGAGFSYMEAQDGVYNFKMIPGSKSYYFAGAEPYLVGDAIMDKVQAGLDWVNQYCPRWKQNRQKRFQLMHQRASYLDAEGTERGSFSEIIAQIVDKSGKTRGKRGRKATFEEGGSFPKLEDALEISLGSMREGTVYSGQVTVFGTGGEKGAGIQGIENIFNYPDAWDMMAFPNVWEEGLYGTSCGYFVPCYRANSWFMDLEGNVDMESAIAADEIEREKKRKSNKAKDLDRRVAEYPRTPAEALQRLTNNGFNKAEIQAQIRRIQTDKAIQGLIRYGQMIRTPTGVEFVIQSKLKANPIEEFPHNQDDDLEGCVAIVQRPWTDQLGVVPRGMYLITFDPYAKEESEDLTSLFSIKVWKQENVWDTSYIDLPVAWYSGRPKNLNRVYEILFMLCDMYNCTAQGEIAGGGQGVFSWAKTHHILHRLEKEPEMLHNKEVASKSAGNSYLMNMGGDRKNLGILYLEDWHEQPRGVNELGHRILNVHRIYDIAFLREMEKHSTDGNFDRISDAIIYMYMMKERVASIRKERRANKEFYSNQRILFGETGSGSFTEMTTMY